MPPGTRGAAPERGEAREGTSPLRAFRGTIRGRPRFAVICHQAGSRAQEALRWLAERCGKDPSTMPGACAAKAQSPVQFGSLKRGKARRGTSPAGLLGACGARARRDAAALRAIEKRPPRARRPALPQPCAAVLSAKAGLTAGFGMGPGDPRLCGRARGGRSPAAHDMEPARNPSPGRPWRPHGGHGRRSRIALGACHRGCEELGLLVPLG